MDPNANLQEALRIVRRLIADNDEATSPLAEVYRHAADAHRLADLVEALDVWISGGGFLPERWQRGKPGGYRSLGFVRDYVRRTAHAHEDDNTFARGEWMEILAARQLLEAVGGCSCGATGCEQCDPAMAPPTTAAFVAAVRDMQNDMRTTPSAFAQRWANELDQLVAGTIPESARQLWAAYSGTATGDGISLHATEREALMAVATGLGIDEEDEDRGPLSAFDDDDLREVFDAYCEGRADDWSVQEVTLP